MLPSYVSGLTVSCLPSSNLTTLKEAISTSWCCSLCIFSRFVDVIFHGVYFLLNYGGLLLPDSKNSRINSTGVLSIYIWILVLNYLRRFSELLAAELCFNSTLLRFPWFLFGFFCLFSSSASILLAICICPHSDSILLTFSFFFLVRFHLFLFLLHIIWSSFFDNYDWM